MKKFFKSLFFIIFLFLALFNISNANINFTVSPIKYEIEASTGTTITKTATLLNRTDTTLTIYTGKSDFEAKNDSGEPVFVRKNSEDETGQELSNWIEIDTESFEILPKEEKEITFNINIPENATPGGHYGAIFFKNVNAGTDSTGQIKINVDYGVLLLVNVDGEIIKDGEVKETIISSSGGGDGSGWGLQKDDCPFGDYTKSYYDGKCINNINEILGIENEENLDLDENLENTQEEDFSIKFSSEFENTGNTHIKPEGEIKLIDEDGNEIKGIGKEVVLNEDGAIIGEEIVDYLPINDIGGNVLPSTNREFEVEWKGFPYKDYDDEGNQIIKYWTPGEYYTNKNLENNNVIMPWERLEEEVCTKTITAVTEISYIDENGEEVTFNSAKDFDVTYKQTIVGINPYFFFGAGILLFILFILWLIFRKKKKRCQKCNKKIDKDMKICPYCGKKQKD